MDYIFGVGAMLFIGGLGTVAMLKMVDSRFPSLTINVFDRGLLQKMKFRKWGYTIVKDEIFKLLLNEPEICGDSRELEFDVEKGLSGLNRVYRAYRRHDYLFALKQVQHVKATKKGEDGKDTIVDLPLTSVPPVLEAVTENGKTIKATISKDGWLLPFRIAQSNDALQEVEVTNGKSICVRFIDSQKSTQAYLNNANPFVSVLLTMLPMIIIVIAVGVMLYLVFGTTADNMTQIALTQSETTRMLAELIATLKK
jgi:hypothetical protein